MLGFTVYNYQVHQGSVRSGQGASGLFLPHTCEMQMSMMTALLMVPVAEQKGWPGDIVMYTSKRQWPLSRLVESKPPGY